MIVRVPVPADSAGPWRVGTKATAGSESLQDRFDVTRPPRNPRRADGVPRAPSGAVAAARRGRHAFRRTERIHLEWPILAADRRREGRLLGRNGLPIPIPVTLTERDVNGHRVLAADVNLAPLTEADYVIEIEAGAGPESDRRLIAIASFVDRLAGVVRLKKD